MLANSGSFVLFDAPIKISMPPHRSITDMIINSNRNSFSTLLQKNHPLTHFQPTPLQTIHFLKGNSIQQNLCKVTPKIHMHVFNNICMLHYWLQRNPRSDTMLNGTLHVFIQYMYLQLPSLTHYCQVVKSSRSKTKFSPTHDNFLHLQSVYLNNLDH